MVAVLTFAVVLLAALLVSKLAERTVLSTAALFLVAGFAARAAGLIAPTVGGVELLAELALVGVLFSDALKVRLGDLLRHWRLPARALLLGLPLTLLAVALLGRLLAGLSWLEALLVGAVLSPTDPVLAQAIVGQSGIPHRLRHLLNVESGLNDGLALPAVLVLLSLMGGEKVGILTVLGELGLGLALGVAVPFCVCRLLRIGPLAVARSHEPLFAFAVAILVFALAKLTHANEYVAAFAAGVTFGNARAEAGRADPLSDALAELLKLAALLVFGALLSPAWLAEAGPAAYAFAALVLLVARPAALGLSLLGAPLTWREWFAALWFGPRGFASVVYGLLLLRSGLEHGAALFGLVALAVAASILAHSSTDVLVARWFAGEGSEPAEAGSEPAETVPR